MIVFGGALRVANLETNLKHCLHNIYQLDNYIGRSLVMKLSFGSNVSKQSCVILDLHQGVVHVASIRSQVVLMP